jgi:RHS repeat-associated protein
VDNRCCCRHLATYSGGTTNFLHTDWLGTKRAMSSVAGAQSTTCTGLPFGESSGCATSWNFNSFTDDYHDSETNTEHTLFRQLSTTEGRWLSPDPAGMAAVDLTNPQSLNMYAYVDNNPINSFDPLGLKSLPGCNEDHPDGHCIISVAGPSQNCTIDGLDATCSMTLGTLTIGAGCLGSCATSVTGSNGKTYNAVQTAGPTVYMAPNGEELSDGSIAELGLPPLSGLGFSPFANGGGGGPVIPAMYCDPNVIKAMNKAFQMTMNGMAPNHVEASFFIKMRSDGSFITTTPVSSFESMKNTVAWDPAGVAFGHVHPNGSNPWPTPGPDTSLASRFHVPIFTFGSGGLWQFTEGDKNSIKLRAGLTWTKPCK